MPFSRIARREWRWRFTNPSLILVFAVVYDVLLEVNEGIWHLVSLVRGVNCSGSYLNKLCNAAIASLFIPLPWAASVATWTMIRGDLRSGCMRDLRLSPLRSRDLFWIKMPPLALFIGLAIFLGSVRHLWLEVNMNIGAARMLVSVTSRIPTITDARVITGLTFGAGALHAAVFGSAAACLMCAWMILLPHRASSWTSAIFAGLTTAVFIEFSFAVGLYLNIQTKTRWDFPVDGMPWLPMREIWEAVIALPFVVVICAWLIPRFGRVFEAD